MTDATFTGLCWAFVVGAVWGACLGFLWGGVHTAAKLRAMWDTDRDDAR
jgi:hypothetical protein